MTIWITSDLHFDHGNIMKYSGRTQFMSQEELHSYNAAKAMQESSDPSKNSEGHGMMKRLRISQDSIERMNHELIESINRYVRPHDQLLMLGDFSFSRNFNTVKKHRDAINCKNIIVTLGNHDNYHWMSSIFGSNKCHHIYKFKDHKQTFYCCHYSMLVWNRSHHGTIQVHGHSHDTMNHWWHQSFPGARTMDVGVETAYRLFHDYRPFSTREIIDLLPGTGHNVDHHNPQTT